MCQAGVLQGSLSGTEPQGIRTVLRPAPALAPTASADMVRLDRGSRSHHHSDAHRRRRPNDLVLIAARAALDRIDIAFILLHADRHVLLSNAAAMRAQARGDCFCVRGRRVHLVDHQSQHALVEFLRRRGSATLPLGGPICVASRDNGLSCYILFADWLELPVARDSIALLQIHEPRSGVQLDPGMLGGLYGLTPAESSLVAALYATPCLVVAAHQRGISLNTAKTHLKRVFTKCGVSSKAELLRLLALGPRLSLTRPRHLIG